MKHNISKLTQITVSAIFFALLGFASGWAQGTGFVYQGRLTDSNLPVNAPYDFQFRLFDAQSGGTPISANDRNNVTVSNGNFSVILDFGAGAFPGANRWLEISARPASGSAFTLLTPRLPISPTPYAITAVTLPAPAQGKARDSRWSITGNGFEPGLTLVAMLPDGGEMRLRAPMIEVLTPQSLRVRSPLLVSGAWALRLVNPDGESSAAFTFKVKP